jgi:hypothetical protein
VLEDLVGVDDVMAAVELEEVGHAELDAGVVGLGGGDGLGRAVHPTTEATRPARSAVMLPGPHPTSSSVLSARRCGGRSAHEFSAVRHRCERSTGSEWPCV